MAISPIPVDQRVIDIDSRRFASIEKALVELITNCDDSYERLGQAGKAVSGKINVHYERHQAGAVLRVADQAEGMNFEQARFILAYGGAHSSLARGEGGGRGYFGRGLKQAIYGLGYGWIETIRDRRLTRIELFRGENGGYLYDDGNGDRPAQDKDYERLGTDGNGTRVSIVVDNSGVNISQFRTLEQAVVNNVYLRDILARRDVELIHLQRGRESERSGTLRYEEPDATLLLGPEASGEFVYQQQSYPFTLTLKRANSTELTLHGDERTNGLLVQSGMAVLDCQLFDYENQVGTEYLFGTVNCPVLIDKLSQGVAIISDEREGLNHKEPLVAAFSHAVSRMIQPYVLAELEKLRHLEHASASNRTGQMIEHLLERMSRAATQDLGIIPPPLENPAAVEEPPAALRFSTPFYYRQSGHPFHVSLLLDPAQFGDETKVHFEYRLPEGMSIEPMPTEMALNDLAEPQRVEWTLRSEEPGAHGEITARAGPYWAWCELVVADQNAAPHHNHHHKPPHPGNEHHLHHRLARDHGEAMFLGYEFRYLDNELERAVYSPQERKILINTGAPTVQLYLDGRGHFRDSARLLLAELLMDVISDELALRSLAKSAKEHDAEAVHAAKLEIIRRYGSEIHRSFFTA